MKINSSREEAVVLIYHNSYHVSTVIADQICIFFYVSVNKFALINIEEVSFLGLFYENL